MKNSKLKLSLLNHENLEKFRSFQFPELEIIYSIGKHQHLIKDYTFPEFLLRKEFNFSKEALLVIKNLQKENATIVDLLVLALKKGVTHEKLVTYISWDIFEDLVQALFHLSGWEAIRTFRFKSLQPKRSNFEIDIVTWNPRKRTIFMIDCKRYKNASKSIIRVACEKQLNRVKHFVKTEEKLSSKFKHLEKGEIYNIYPLIITWKDHLVKYDSMSEGKMPICKIQGLNDFIIKVDHYLSDAIKIPVQA